MTEKRICENCIHCDTDGDAWCLHKKEAVKVQDKCDLHETTEEAAQELTGAIA